MAADPTVLTLTGDPIIEEARKRFNQVSEWESYFRRMFLQDWKFANGDSYNGYQWPESIRRTRDVADRPCLTMNITRQHNLKIANEGRQNKSSVRLIGTGNGATQESANILKNIIRYIERRSNAQTAFTHAREFQVNAGYGAWRIVTEYESNETFDQEIRILPILDPLSVCVDPDCQQSDKSDMNWGFVFDFLPNDVFEENYPDHAPGGRLAVGQTPLGIGTGESFWIEKEHTMICEYFRKVKRPDVLVSFWDEQSQRRWNIRKSRMPGDLFEQIADDKLTRTRDIYDTDVEWYLIAGEQIIDQTLWLGSYIPLIIIVGQEVITEGILDRKGHTRSMIDAQRMYNYNASSQVEFVALQGKAPWVGEAKAIEEYENYWNTANTENHSFLPYNGVDEDNPDRNIPMPQRTDPPNFSPAYEKGMETAFNQLMMTSGQWQNEMGMVGNERTGRAIERRQEQSATSVFHFQDEYAAGLRNTYVQIIELIPLIYDTRRVRFIEADDGEEFEVEIDPQARQAYQVYMDRQGRAIARIFNPNIGKYAVDPQVGPDSGTRRQEAVDAFTMILTEAPGLTGLIGDLMLRNLPFEDAQEAALRLKRMVPPQALGQGPTQNEQQQQQMIQQLQAALSKAMERQGKDQLKLAGKDQMRDIDAYEAETKRMQALAAMLPTDSQGLQQIIHQLVGDSLQTHLLPILRANMAGTIAEGGNGAGGGTTNGGSSSGNGRANGSTGSSTPGASPFPGARQASDGEWYILDPTRRGKYLRVGPLAQERALPKI